MTGTTHYNFTLPQNLGDNGIWGTELNGSLSNIDSTIWSATAGMFQGINVASSSSTITLTNPLVNGQNITFTAAGQSLVLPPMNTSTSPQVGGVIEITNAGTNSFQILAQDASTVVYASLNSGQTVRLKITSVSTANGTFSVVNSGIGFSGGAIVGTLTLNGGTVRTPLTSNMTVYVATTGSDSNTGTSGSPWLTLQHAWNTVVNNYDLAGFQITIQLADGTYTSGLNNVYSTNTVLDGVITIQGNAITPSNVLISVTGANAFNLVGVQSIYIQYLKIQTTTSGNGIFCDEGAVVSCGPLVFGTIAGSYAIWCDRNSVVALNGNITFTGNCASLVTASENGKIYINSSLTWTFTGSPTVSNAAFIAYNSGIIFVPSTTFTGTLNGQRYLVTTLGQIQTGTSGNETYLPGTTAGVRGSGGLYDSKGLLCTVKTQIFTSSGTYTPSTGMQYCIVEAVGGGGGGGSSGSSAGGGGGGGYIRATLTASTIGTSQTVTIGAGGAVITAGGTTSLGSILQIAGGSGAGVHAGPSAAVGVGLGGAGGSTATGGDFVAPGGAGGNGTDWSIAGTSAGVGGVGGSSRFGGGGPAVTGSSPQNGSAGLGYGGGGSGQVFNGTSGAGSNGILIITEYCIQ